MINADSSETRLNKLCGELILLLAFIIATTAFLVWLHSLSHEERKILVDNTLSIATLVLAQPGVFLTAKVATNTHLPLVKRVTYSLASFSVVAWAIPVTLTGWVSAHLPL